MPTLISAPVPISVPGGKLIAEFVGRVASGDTGVSIAQMSAPAGWDEPVTAGQAIIARAGERIRYSCPDGAKYLAVCLPAFGTDLVQREGS